MNNLHHFLRTVEDKEILVPASLLCLDWLMIKYFLSLRLLAGLKKGQKDDEIKKMKTQQNSSNIWHLLCEILLSLMYSAKLFQQLIISC